MPTIKPNTNTAFPPPLKPGGTIGIVSPASWSDAETIAKSKKILEKRGYKVVVHAQNALRDGRLAGNDKTRADAIMEMFADKNIDAIVCARGGVGGSIRIADMLDYKLIKKNPKPFVGFSDITFLLQAITKRCGFATYHGPVSLWLSDTKSADDLFAVIGSRKKNRKLHFPKIECLRPGRAEGKLVGGNMTLLQSLIGTPYDWSAKDAILFIEDVDEVLYKLDRTLRHFLMAGNLRDVRAVLVGEMAGLTDGEPGKPEKAFGRSLKQIVTDIFPDIPLCMNFPCGHSKYVTTLPVGAQAKLKLDIKGAELSF